MILPKDIRNIARISKLIFKKYNEEKLINIEHKRYLICAMILHKNNHVIGFNNYIKTHPLTKQIHPRYILTTHAEIDALNKWNENWRITNSTTLYTIGLTPHGNYCTSKPCKSCMETIKEFNIKRIVYCKALNNNSIFSINQLSID